MGVALAVALAFAVAAAGTALVLRARLGSRAAAPGQERWRTDAVPRLGGLAMLAGGAAGSGVLLATGDIAGRQIGGFLAGAALICAVGVLDDLRELRPLHKVIAQILAAAVLLATGTTVEIVDFEPLASVLTFFWVIAMTNAFNLLDNMDGLAGGVAFIGASVLAVHAHLEGLPMIAAVSAVVAATVAGFLPFNLRLRKRAAIFMGDGGSQLLGFSLAWLALSLSWHEASGLVAAIAVPLLVLAVPILDTTLVSVMRLIEGRPIHQGGRDHTSHRLVVHGLSEKRAVMMLIGASALLGASSLAYVGYGRLGPALAGLALSVAVLVHFAMFLAQARRSDVPPEPGDTQSWLSVETYRLHKRRLAEGLIDLCLIVAAYYIAYVLRYDGLPDRENAELIAQSLPVLVACRYVAFLYFGLYRGLWRYAGTRDVARAFAAVVASEAAAVAALTLFYRFDGYSRTVFVIDAILCFMLVAGSRLAERGIGEWLTGQRDRRGVPRAVIVGAGDAGNSLLRELRRRGEHIVAGFVDDDPRKRGRRSQGVPVLGDHRDIELILDAHRPEVVYVTIPDAPQERLDRVRDACDRAGARYWEVRSGASMPRPATAAEPTGDGPPKERL